MPALRTGNHRGSPYIGTPMVQASRLLLLVVVMIGSVTISEQTAAADPSKKVRIGYPSSAVSTLPFDIAKEKGFYIKAGVDVEYIQMRSALSARRRYLNGNIHFFTSPQSAINAAVAGLPLVVVLSLYRDTPWVLVTNKEINNASGLGRQTDSPSQTSARRPTISPGPDCKNSAWKRNKSPGHHRRNVQQLRHSDEQSSRRRGIEPAL